MIAITIALFALEGRSNAFDVSCLVSRWDSVGASVGQAAEPQLSSMRCFASPAAPVTAYAPAKEAAMSADASSRSENVAAPGNPGCTQRRHGLDVFARGQVWKALGANAMQAEALHVGSILPMDPEEVSVTADDKDIASEKREADALELGLEELRRNGYSLP
ncbi:type VI lipase adapter Tla3 domain-containing protein [Pseudomonas aeruginosa]